MGNSFRNQPFPSLYPPQFTSPTYSLQTAHIYYCLAIVAVSFLLILPGVRELKRCWLLLRIYTALWIVGVLVVCNYSSWYGGTICTKTQYKPHTEKNTPQEIQAEVGLYISLRGINITLIEKECDSSPYTRPFPHEIIHYNEHFSWANPWGQGRRDFGKYGGIFNQEFRAAKYRGVPYPITRIAEHFTIDGEQIRWYRKFRQAGWCTHIIMWAAFATHFLSIILFMTNIRLGAWQMATTGSLMIMACLAYWAITLNDPVLQIHFPDQTLRPTFTRAYWLTLVTGIATLLIACGILTLELVMPRKVATFFNYSTIPDDLIFEIDEESEPTEQKFTRTSRRKSSISTNNFSRDKQLRRRTTRQTLDETPSECEADQPNVSQVSFEEKKERPCSVVYSSQEVSSTPSSRSDDCTSSPVVTCHEFGMEIQVAEIVIQCED